MPTRNVIILLLAILALGSLSCKKWLEVQPKDKYTEPQIFANGSGAFSALNGMYLQLASPYLYGRNLTMSLVEILGQRYNITASHNLVNIQSYNYADEGVKLAFDPIWENGYVVIVNANQFLRNLDVYAANIPRRYDSVMRGEAMAMRALLHFDLLRLYGPIYNSKDSIAKSIPYYRSATSTIGELLPASQVVDSVLYDLEEAARLLQGDPIVAHGVVTKLAFDGNDWLTNRNCRLNYFAVKALQARVHMYRNNKPAALEAAKWVVDNASKWFPWIVSTRIMSDKTNPDRIFSTELLFALFNIDLYNQNRVTFAPEVEDGRILYPNDTRLKAIFESNEADYRYNPNWILPTAGGKSYRTFYKYTDITSKDSAWRFKMPMVRISEMYYIMAESEPDAVKARGYINVVRKARGLADVAATAVVNTELQKEYQKEFVGEGQLFYYYKRRNITAIPNSAAASGNVSMNAAKYIVPLPLSETQYR